MSVVITSVRHFSLELLTPIISASESEGWQFVRRLVDEWDSGINRFDRPGERLFGAYDDEKLVGVCGLNADPYLPDARIGRVRRLYVLPTHRKQGIGQKLVHAVIAAASGRFRLLRLRTTNPAADQLYQRIGFVPVAGVAECTHQFHLDGS